MGPFKIRKSGPICAIAMTAPFTNSCISTQAEWPDWGEDSSIMNDAIIQAAKAYALKHNLALGEQLGSGIHGAVFFAENKVKGGRSAIKGASHFLCTEERRTAMTSLSKPENAKRED